MATDGAERAAGHRSAPARSGRRRRLRALIVPVRTWGGLAVVGALLFAAVVICCCPAGEDPAGPADRAYAQVNGGAPISAAAVGDTRFDAALAVPVRFADHRTDGAGDPSDDCASAVHPVAPAPVASDDLMPAAASAPEQPGDARSR